MPEVTLPELAEVRTKLAEALGLVDRLMQPPPAPVPLPSTKPLVPIQSAPTAPSSLTNPLDRPFAWGKRFSQEERRFLNQTALDFGLDPDDIPSCIAFETIETFSPTIRPKRKDGTLISSAVGLIQFLESTAEELGTTTEALAGMTRRKQLEYVWRYFRNRISQFGPLHDLADVYMAIHWPTAIGKPLTATMYVAGSAAYAANGGLDLNHDHVITKAEAASLVMAKKTKGREKENYG